jgi:hypothetical protein
MNQAFTTAEVALLVRDSCSTRDPEGNPCGECEAVAHNLELAAQTMYTVIQGVDQMREILLETRLGQGTDGNYLMVLERSKGEQLVQHFLQLHHALALYAKDSIQVGELLQLAPPKQELH